MSAPRTREPASERRSGTTAAERPRTSVAAAAPTRRSAKRRGFLRGLRRFGQIGGAERWLFVGAWVVLAGVRLALWITPSAWVVRRVLARPTGAVTPAVRIDARTIGTAVNRAARFVPRATCLPQALATLWLMAGRGQTGFLRIGVKKGEGGALLAHAWVEHENRVVIGNYGVKQYAVMPGLEGVLFLR